MRQNKLAWRENKNVRGQSTGYLLVPDNSEKVSYVLCRYVHLFRPMHPQFFYRREPVEGRYGPRRVWFYTDNFGNQWCIVFKKSLGLALANICICVYTNANPKILIYEKGISLQYNSLILLLLKQQKHHIVGHNYL